MASFDVIFIGGGPAGYIGAIRAAQLGMSVAVVEREGLGGTCVLWGCIPAKALLESASLATKVGKAQEFGITVGDVKLDYGVAMKRSRAVSTQNSKGVEYLFKKNKITWIKGTGRLAGKNAVTVKADGKEEKHEAKKAVVISTGSRVKGLPQIGLELNKNTVISSDEALILESAPKTMAIVGAGAVGCEFADVFTAFGTQVSLIEVLPGILPLEDADCSSELTRSFKKRKIDVLSGARISDVKVGKNSVTMNVEVGGKKQPLEVEKVLVAAGRAPNIEDIGIKEAGIQMTERGFIKINERMETSVKGVYAIGDVAGPPMLAHKGMREGVVFAEFLAGLPHPHTVNYGNIPSATYCHPEVASIGMTEAQVKEKKIDYKVGKFPFMASGRARTSGETEGFVKIIRDSKYGEILGAHIIGSHATELIHELAVARENEFTVEEVALAIHAHPTLSEAVDQAVLDSMGMVLDA
ncbi:MAG TPA: dihydrolipoyl dehydrogenase [Gemmatimonadaceae bacterium]|jgi:dihydrolipoamide dehydrogenase|nr:dihydrolipoyl dehydrogenase [Gemmatimonadaceae bacterium]